MLDDAGNITLNRAADEYIPMSWVDDAGVEIDISQADLRLIVDKGFTLLPDRDPGNAKGRLLHFTELHAQSLTKPRDYILLLTQGSDNTVLMSGTISAVGFKP
jgi:hypothetical protein